MPAREISYSIWSFCPRSWELQ